MVAIEDANAEDGTDEGIRCGAAALEEGDTDFGTGTVFGGDGAEGVMMWVEKGDLAGCGREGWDGGGG